MRRILVLLVGFTAVALVVLPSASASDGRHARLTERFQHTSRIDPRVRRAASQNFVLIGHHDLGGGGFNADVYSFGNYAYVGVWGAGEEACPATGVKVVDLRLPMLPRLVSVLQNPALTTAEDVVVQHVSTPSFTGDLAVTGIQSCAEGTFHGLQFFDVTNPQSPRELGRWASPGNGCHEIDLVSRADGRVLAACATPFAEVVEGEQEVHLVDASNPAAPAKLGGFGLIAELGEQEWLAFGCFPASFAHSVRFADAGMTLYASYWDAGTLRFDVSDPAAPVLGGRTVIVPPDEDGDNHSMSLGKGGSVLLINPEDFSPVDEEAGFCPPGDWNGWGELYIYDNSNPAETTFLSSFGTPNSRSKRTDGFYSIHNSEVVGGDQVFASWYTDGIRWIDIADPAHPFEKGYFVPEPAADPLGFFPPIPIVWGVWPHRGTGPALAGVPGPLILASDINSGLWILLPVRFGAGR